jgi:RimJ/RimL family protein N-acetyltransferase
MQPEEVDVLREMVAVEDIRTEFKNIAALGRSDLERELMVRSQVADYAGYPWLWIINKATKEIVGFILARNYTSPRKAKQIYYAIRPSSRGQKFAAEALAGLAQQFWTVEKVSIVFVRGEAKNEGSKKTALAAGFRGIIHRKIPNLFFGYIADMEPIEAIPLIAEFLEQPSTQTQL